MAALKDGVELLRGMTKCPAKGVVALDEQARARQLRPRGARGSCGSAPRHTPARRRRRAPATRRRSSSFRPGAGPLRAASAWSWRTRNRRRRRSISRPRLGEGSETLLGRGRLGADFGERLRPPRPRSSIPAARSRRPRSRGREPRRQARGARSAPRRDPGRAPDRERKARPIRRQQGSGRGRRRSPPSPSRKQLTPPCDSEFRPGPRRGSSIPTRCRTTRRPSGIRLPRLRSRGRRRSTSAHFR